MSHKRIKTLRFIIKKRIGNKNKSSRHQTLGTLFIVLIIMLYELRIPVNLRF